MVCLVQDVHTANHKVTSRARLGALACLRPRHPKAGRWHATQRTVESREGGTVIEKRERVPQVINTARILLKLESSRLPRLVSLSRWTTGICSP